MILFFSLLTFLLPSLHRSPLLFYQREDILQYSKWRERWIEINLVLKTEALKLLLFQIPHVQRAISSSSCPVQVIHQQLTHQEASNDMREDFNVVTPFNSPVLLKCDKMNEVCSMQAGSAPSEDNANAREELQGLDYGPCSRELLQANSPASTYRPARRCNRYLSEPKSGDLAFSYGTMCNRKQFLEVGRSIDQSRTYS